MLKDALLEVNNNVLLQRYQIIVILVQNFKRTLPWSWLLAFPSCFLSLFFKFVYVLPVQFTWNAFCFYVFKEMWFFHFL